MAEVRCVDGSRLGVVPVPVMDRHGEPYELTLLLHVDGQPFGDVGERCGWFLAATAARLRSSLRDGSPESVPWPELDDRFPAPSLDAGLRAWAVDDGRDPDAALAVLSRYLPRDRDLFAFRHRDPDDVASAGELRCSLHASRTWVDGTDASGAGGRWRVSCRAVLDAWGDAGRGVRAVLTAPELATFLDALLRDAAAFGCVYDLDEAALPLRRPAG